jgi:transcription elongation factor GreB
VADPSVHHGSDQVFFGATVTYANEQGEERTITIKGIDEADSLPGRGELGRADRARAAEGPRRRRGHAADARRVERIEVLAVSYPGAPKA